jgi:hypothetical protein
MNSEEKLNYSEDERNTLNLLYEGEMTFSQAAELLGVSKEKIKEMFESFKWIPSSAYMQEIYEIEEEVMAHIESESKRIDYQTVNRPCSYKLSTFNGSNVTPILDASILATSVHFIQKYIPVTNIIRESWSGISCKIEGRYQV